jgi:hypothetical protein
VEDAIEIQVVPVVQMVSRDVLGYDQKNGASALGPFIVVNHEDRGH